MPSPRRILPRSPISGPACIAGDVWNKAATMIEKVDAISGSGAITVNSNDSGVNISLASSALTPVLINLTGTLTAGGLYKGNPIYPNVSGLNTTNALTTASLGITNSAIKVICLNTDEIGMGTNHWVPVGGSNWNPVFCYASNGAALIGTLGAQIMLFSWSVKGREFPVTVAQTGGANGTISGGAVTINTYTYTALDNNGGTALTTASPSAGHHDYGAVMAATLGTIFINASGTAILQTVIENNGGGTC